MDTEYALFIAVTAVALGTALLAMITQWLKADDAAADAEIGVRLSLQQIHDKVGSGVETEVVRSLTDEPAVAQASAARLGDDETALGRLFAGWGGAGLLLGMAFGGSVWGPTGALLGGVAVSTLSIAAVVVAVVAVDRVHARQAQEKRLAAEARAREADPSAQGAVRVTS